MMVIVFEISRPFQAKPFFMNSEIALNIGWMWFAIRWIKISFDELVTTEFEWTER